MSSTISILGYLAGTTRFRRISEKLYVDGDKIYKEAGIHFKASWFPVYYVLALSDDPLTIMQIAGQIDFSHITVKNVIRELELAELVVIQVNPVDKRSKLVSLSIIGQKLLYRLKPLWISIATALKTIFQTAHPDFLNILNRIDRQIDKNSLHAIAAQQESEPVHIIDYRPSLKNHFHELAGPWLTGGENGSLQEEGGFLLQNPDESFFMEGGFLFYARYRDQIVGCVALKRLDESSFEFTKLYINPNYRNLGIATLLIERCISRCIENETTELWLQSGMSSPEEEKLYAKFGFSEQETPVQMLVSEGMEKIMCLEL
jgi:N-acetylglutamate synthase-like GNAT family acetyltransferase/DNA-binding MarR family transcriptional regulator